jgi:hypothetical protein
VRGVRSVIAVCRRWRAARRGMWRRTTGCRWPTSGRHATRRWTADGQPHAGPVRFGGEERFEDLIGLRWQADAGIADRHPHLVGLLEASSSRLRVSRSWLSVRTSIAVCSSRVACRVRSATSVASRSFDCRSCFSARRRTVLNQARSEAKSMNTTRYGTSVLPT